VKTTCTSSILEIIALALALIIFGLPLSFVVLNAGKNTTEAARMNMVIPERFEYLDNFTEVIEASDAMLIRAFYNSTVITVLAIVILILIASTAGFVMDRRHSRAMNWINVLVLAGLMVPPAVVPTIWLLRGIGLYKTLTGLVLVQAALSFPFSVMLYRGYVGAIPRELDEASFIDGCTGLSFFTRVMFPLMKPVTATVTIITSINIFNDFVNPLYFLPGARNATVQLTLYNFMSVYSTRWNLLFADVFLISIPPLIFFIFFNKKIVTGMVAGAVKG
jgi:raffinose/stachyose/melibiose transport system permease protein